jgi:hypothetical protein
LSNNQLVNGEPELEEVCHRYYEDLYSEPTTEASEADRAAILGKIPRKFDQVLNESLGRPITTEELRSAVEAMAKERAPGLDGINVAFYLTHWSLLGEEF